MMLVPATRLLWLVFYAALIGLAAGPLPQLAPVWLLALGAIAFAALLDAVWSLRGAELPKVHTSPIARFMRDREGTLEIGFTNPGGKARRVRVGFALPAIFESAESEIQVDLPPGAERARAAWRCTPRRRGRYADVVACLEGDSILRLWRVRARTPLPCELRVHPNLMHERKHIAALFLARGRTGVRVHRTLGRGREFEKLRDYQPGDGFDEIHWKATAKRGRPVTKVFQAERTQEIYVVIDGSRLSGRPVMHGGFEQTVLERYVSSALVLLIAAARQGDKFGLVAYDDRVRVSVRAGMGTKHYAACREAVLGLAPTEATPDIPEIIRFLKTRLRQRALLFFLTDLSDPVLAEDFARHVRVLARQHLVLVGHLPAPEVAALFTGPEVARAEELYGRLAGHLRWAESRLLAQQLRPLGVTHVTLENEAMAAQLISEYMAVKARQAL